MNDGEMECQAEMTEGKKIIPMTDHDVRGYKDTVSFRIGIRVDVSLIDGVDRAQLLSEMRDACYRIARKRVQQEIKKKWDS